MMYRNWPVPLPQVDPEEPPTDQPLPDGITSVIQTLGDGTVWETTGAGWQRLPHTDPHEIRRVHRVVPAMDAAVRIARGMGKREQPTSEELQRIIEVAGGDDVALIEACADVAMLALKKPDRGVLGLAAAVLSSASHHARYDPRALAQARQTQ